MVARVETENDLVGRVLSGESPSEVVKDVMRKYKEILTEDFNVTPVYNGWIYDHVVDGFLYIG